MKTTIINNVEKKKTPKFRTRESIKKKRVNDSWRKPKGLHNKQRLQKKGLPVVVKIGYRTQNSIRGLHRSGLMPVVVSTIKELELLNKEKEGAIISAKTGQKKRTELLKKTKELGLVVLNLKVDDYINKIEEKIKAKKGKKTEKEKQKEESKKEKEKKAAEKEKKPEQKEEKTEEDKKKEEKKEQDKILAKGL